ncbi:MAG: FxsA family protein [Planifilum fimeticola]
MFRIFILLLILIPLLEIWGLAQMGKWIGALPTVLAVIVTSVIGVVLAHRQGLEVYRLTMLQLNRGELPSDTLLDGLLILMGGLLLMAPGFFTDAVGFLLLIPYIRGILRLLMRRWFEKMAREGRVIRITRRW